MLPMVSIRRADYWLVEVALRLSSRFARSAFQSAGRIIGWLKARTDGGEDHGTLVSIRRADYWLVEGGVGRA